MVRESGDTHNIPYFDGTEYTVISEISSPREVIVYVNVTRDVSPAKMSDE